MTPEERSNEHVKLIGNWLNTLATGIMTAGAFLPAAQFIFNLLRASTDNGLVVGIGVVCIVAGLGIHLLGHVILGGFLR